MAGMRVLYVTPFFVPIIGGVETVVYETCSSLTKRGHECHVVTSPVEGLPAAEAVGGINVHRPAALRIPASGTPDPNRFTWRDVGGAFRAIVDEVQPDVVHLHNFHMRQYAMYALPMLGSLDPTTTPALMTIHNTTSDPFAHYLLSYLPLARVVALTNQSAMDLLTGGVPSHRVRVLPNLIEAAKFQEADGRAVRADLDLGDGPVILFPSRIVGREGNVVYQGSQGKGLDVLLRALPLILRDVPDVKLLLMGNDPIYPTMVRKVRREILDLAHIFGMDENVVFFEGAIPQERLPEIYAASDVVVSLGPTECFGMVFLEGMAAGKPVVGVDSMHNGVPEVVWGGRAGILVPPNDPWRTAKAVVGILGVPGRAEEMGRQGIRWVRARYDTNAVLPKLLAMYEEARGEPLAVEAPVEPQSME